MPIEQPTVEVVKDSEAPDANDLAHLASSSRMVVMRLARRLRAERSDETLGLSQLSALGQLETYGPQSPTALAERERIQPPSMTRVIAHLEERHLVEREPHATDRRQSVIAITEAGSAIIREDRKRRQAWLARALETMDEADREKLAAAIPILERLGRA